MVIKELSTQMLFYPLHTIWKDQAHMVIRSIILVNTEGRIQMGNEVVPPAGHSK